MTRIPLWDRSSDPNDENHPIISHPKYEILTKSGKPVIELQWVKADELWQYFIPQKAQKACYFFASCSSESLWILAFSALTSQIDSLLQLPRLKKYACRKLLWERWKKEGKETKSQIDFYINFYIKGLKKWKKPVVAQNLKLTCCSSYSDSKKYMCTVQAEKC